MTNTLRKSIRRRVYTGRGRVGLVQWIVDQWTLMRLPAIGREVYEAVRIRETAR